MSLCKVLEVSSDSIRGKAPSFNVSVGDCTPTEKSKWNPPPIEAGDILLLVISCSEHKAVKAPLI